MDPILSDLAEQIKKYISFLPGTPFSRTFGIRRSHRKNRIVWRGANLKELTDFLYKKLRIPVEIGNPFIQS